MTERDIGALLVRVGREFLSEPLAESPDECRTRLFSILKGLTAEEAAVIFPVLAEIGLMSGLAEWRNGVLEVR